MLFICCLLAYATVNNRMKNFNFISFKWINSFIMQNVFLSYDLLINKKKTTLSKKVEILEIKSIALRETST